MKDDISKMNKFEDLPTPLDYVKFENELKVPIIILWAQSKTNNNLLKNFDLRVYIIVILFFAFE